MSEPPLAILAGPPTEGADLLRAALRLNREALAHRGVDVQVAAEADETAAPHAAHTVIVLNAPALPRLAALRDRLDRPFRVIVYVEPPHAALLARVGRALLAGRPLERQFSAPKPIGYAAALDRYEQVFGAENVDFRVSGQPRLSGTAVIDDFWRAAGLPGAPALDLRELPADRRLSLEGALVLDRLITHHDLSPDQPARARVAAAALRTVHRLAGRRLALPRDHVAAVLEASREDIDWLAARVGAPALAEARPRFQEPAWAMDAATLDSLAAFVMRAARQTVELRSLRRRTDDQAA